MQVAHEESTLVDVTRQFLAVARFDRHSQTSFSDQFHHCYHSASLADRIQVSELSCRSHGIPLDVLKLLCCDDNKVASPILSFSPKLGVSDLTTLILQGTETQREAIAKRQDLNSVLVSNLLSFGEIQVAQALLGNVDCLPTLSASLYGRMMRLGGADLEHTGQRRMTNEKDKLDELVSSMEQDWHAHYHPENLNADQPAPESKHAEPAVQAESVSGASSSHQDKPEATNLIDDEDIALLGQLGGTDWEHLDDEAIEALAGKLAEEDIAKLEADSLGMAPDARVSFKIGALDQDNAPVPPLEVKSTNGREAQIAFQGQLDTELDTGAEAVAKTAAQSPSTGPKTGSLEASPFAGFSFAEANPVAQQTTEPMRESSITSNQSLASVTENSERGGVSTDTPVNRNSRSPSEQGSEFTAPSATIAVTPKRQSVEAEERKPKITLTLRKQDPSDVKAPETGPSAEERSVELSSATEEDWLNALARLNSEYEPTATDQFGHEQGLLDALAPPQPLAEEPSRQAPVKRAPTVTISANVSSPASEPRPEEKPSSSETTPLAAEPVIHEHAPMGFMPDMISFAGLDLVEAEPDLPSATELMLGQQQRAAPVSELVEPVELTVRENGEEITLEAMEAAPMKVVAQQLAAERDAKRAENVSATSSLPTAQQDMMDLPAFAEHRVVEAEEFTTMRASELAAETETREAPEQEQPAAQHRSVPLTEISGTTGRGNGIADQFYGYDEETRLTLLQQILADTLVEAAHLDLDITRRALLSDEVADELVMARFSNNRIHLADLMHDISGHRRLDITALLQDTGGEALVVYLYHIGLDESRTLSMVLHGPDAVSHSYNKVSQLMTLYGQLYPAAAAKIVEQLFGASNLKKPTYKPVHDDGLGVAAPRFRDTARPVAGDAQDQKARAFGRRVSEPEK